MATLYQYTFLCTTENTTKKVWRDDSEPVPTKCPDDTTHTINIVSIRITEVVEKNRVIVQEESTPTGGNFRSMCRSITINPNETKIENFIFKYNISALAIEYISDNENVGDQIEMIIGPNTIIGAITNIVNINDNVINVSDTVIQYIQIGYKINLFNGINTEELGYVIEIDKDNKTITTENNSMQLFSHLTPTYVRMNVYVIEDYVIGKAGRWCVGGNKIGGSFIPKNTIIKLIYYNNSNINKNFTAQLEYLY